MTQGIDDDNKINTRVDEPMCFDQNRKFPRFSSLPVSPRTSGNEGRWSYNNSLCEMSMPKNK